MTFKCISHALQYKIFDGYVKFHHRILLTFTLLNFSYYIRISVGNSVPLPPHLRSLLY